MKKMMIIQIISKNKLKMYFTIYDPTTLGNKRLYFTFDDS